MKKTLCLLLVLLCLGMTACGQESQTHVSQTPTEAASGDSTPVSSAEAEETEEAEAEDFIDPTTVVEETTPDGGQVTFYLDAKGRPMYSIQEYPGGYYHEFTYYPSGGTEIWIMTDPSGYCYEEHYMDNGYVKDGIPYDGTLTYRKMIDPDGIVTEMACEYDEKGNRIEKSTSADGTYSETHIEIRDGIETVIFSSSQHADGAYYETHYENGNMTQDIQKHADGSYSEVYYENGEKTKNIYGFNTEDETGYYVEEYYENGIKTKHFQRDRDGEWTEEYDAQGNPLVFHRTLPDGSTIESYYESGKRVYDIAQNTDGTFVEWYLENGINTKYVEGRFNEAGVRVAERVTNDKNRTLEEYERNDAGVVTLYYWTDHAVEKTYYFDDSGALVKYVERIDGEDTTTTNPEKLAQIAAELDMNTP